jgi:hypothetical protein
MSSSEPPSEDGALNAHYAHVEDALTVGGDAVTHKTALAALYRFNSLDMDNRLIQNITGICKVKVPCQILSDFPSGARTLPPSSEVSEPGYCLYLTFNHLVSKPHRIVACTSY